MYFCLVFQNYIPVWELRKQNIWLASVSIHDCGTSITVKCVNILIETKKIPILDQSKWMSSENLLPQGGTCGQSPDRINMYRFICNSLK